MGMSSNFVVTRGFEGIDTLIVNTTPHLIRFIDHDGSIVEIPSNENYILNARAVERDLGAGLVTTEFVGTPEGEALIEQILQEASSFEGPIRIVGSIIAAQAYPEKVVGMTPAKGYERVAPAEKRMSTEKFTVFTK